jgi:alkylated DNA repair protein alkB family protein 6
MVNLNDHKVVGVPDSAYYIPDFVSEQEEQNILNQITKAPKPKWVQLSNRRLQNWGGIPLPKVSQNH